MGGHAAGDVASQLAARTVHARYYQSESTYIVEALREAIETANYEVRELAKRQPDKAGMGCTLTAAVAHGDDLVVGHVGDSRAYLVRGGEIVQLTTDHSWVRQQVEAGLLTQQEADNHPQRHVLTRALGQKDSVQVDIRQGKVMPGDTVVICSDGLTELVRDDEIRQEVTGPSAPAAVRNLINLANQRGAPDNVSVAVLRIDGESGPWPRSVRSGVMPLLAALASAFFLGGIFGWSALAPGGDERQNFIKSSDKALVQNEESSNTMPYVTSSPSPTSFPQILSVRAKEGARLRRGKHCSEDVIELIDVGKSVQIIEDEEGDPVGGNPLWYKVRYGGKEGYVHSSVLTQEDVPPCTPSPSPTTLLSR
jgi:serine/threonine protein phosphatase PrpC